MCSRSVNALLRYFIKRSTLITSSFPCGPVASGLARTEDVVQVSHCEHVRLYTEHMPMFDLVLGCYYNCLSANALS